ncbi:hypothetical protein Thiowin_04802 [Thiorhodovibrio winogradskyi]|uniref:Uncharacterized protein n=1 Tax=Thiorhodovibrio winogradskyi TaxID=77007 RepID=A0ABZ0SII5_9GAMM
MAKRSCGSDFCSGRLRHTGANVQFSPHSARKFSKFLVQRLGLVSRASGLARLTVVTANGQDRIFLGAGVPSRLAIAAVGAHQVGGKLRGDGAVAVPGFINQTEVVVADGLGRVAVVQGVVALGEGGGGLGLSLEQGLALGGGVIRGGHEQLWRRG